MQELEGTSGVVRAGGGAIVAVVEEGTGDPLDWVGARMAPPDAVEAAVQLSTEGRASTSGAAEGTS